MFGKHRNKRREEIIETFDPVIKSKLEEMDAYNKKMASLVSKDLDFAFLEELIKQVDNKVKIDVTLKDGTKIEIRQDKDDNTYRREGIE
jgi:hypothetical protein